MIKALIEVNKVEITADMIVYDYMIMQWAEGVVTVEIVRRVVVDVSKETGKAGQQLTGDQRSEPQVVSKGTACASFLDSIGDENKEGKLIDVREFTEEKND